MSFTLLGWKATTAVLLISKLPLQTYNGVIPFIDSYLSTVGGWVSNDPNIPTGEGEPANGATPDIAVSDIIDSQYSRMYRLSTTATIKLSFEFLANLAPDQVADDVRAQMIPMIDAFISEQLSNTALNYISLETVLGDVAVGGVTTQSHRVGINDVIRTGAYHKDPRAVAVYTARTMYALGDTWNAVSVYTEPDQPIVVIIQKYTNSQYITLDQSVSNQYVISISPDEYTLISGLSIPIIL